MKKKMSSEEAGRLLGEIEQAKESMQGYHSLWRTILDEYCMRNYGTLYNAFSQIADMTQADMMASNARVPYLNLYVRKMLGMVVPRNNEYLLDPRRPDQEVISSILEFAYDGVVQRIDMEEKMVEIGMWALLLGTGIGKVGYASEMVYGQAAWSEKPAGEDELPEGEADTPHRVSTERSIHESQETPTLRVIPTFDYFKDPGSRNDDELRREYVRYRRLLIDAKMDTRYSKSARAKLTGFKLPDNEYIGDDWYNETASNMNDDALYCYVWEVIDIPSGKWCVVSDGLDEPLIDWTDLSLPVGMRSPYIKCRLIRNVGSFFGISYAALMLPAATSMNVVKAQTISQISRDGKKIILYDPNVMQDSDRFNTDIRSAPHMGGVPMPGMADGKKPWDVVDFGGVNPELIRLQTMYQNDLATISQLTDQARNANGSDQTATEANIRNAQQQITVSDLKSSFLTFHTMVARAICRIMLKEWPQSKLIKVMGADPRVYFWYELDRAKVSEDFDIKIVMGTSDQSDRVLVRRQLAELTPQLIMIGDKIAQQQQMQQQGITVSAINWEGMMELLLDQYDPKFKNKILRRKDPLQMVVDLVQTKGLQEVQMSPMLMEQVRGILAANSAKQAQAQMMAQGGFTPEDNGTINNNDGKPFAKSGTPMYAGMPMADSEGFQTGRAASESMMGN